MLLNSPFTTYGQYSVFRPYSMGHRVRFFHNFLQNVSKAFSDRESFLRPVLERRLIRIDSRRYSTAGFIYHYDKDHIQSEEQADKVVVGFTVEEQILLKEALLKAEQQRSKGNGVQVGISSEQVKALFIVNALPFVGFGCLDNMIMILAGEYIDQSLGAALCLSTMAAAAIGNLVSDVAGVGLAHYVEVLVGNAGFKHPVLTAEQLESSKARWTANAARAMGLAVGCIIGMFPLMFFDEDGKDKKETQAE